MPQTLSNRDAWNACRQVGEAFYFEGLRGAFDLAWELPALIVFDRHIELAAELPGVIVHAPSTAARSPAAPSYPRRVARHRQGRHKPVPGKIRGHQHAWSEGEDERAIQNRGDGAAGAGSSRWVSAARRGTRVAGRCRRTRALVQPRHSSSAHSRELTFYSVPPDLRIVSAAACQSSMVAFEN